MTLNTTPTASSAQRHQSCYFLATPRKCRSTLAKSTESSTPNSHDSQRAGQIIFDSSSCKAAYCDKAVNTPIDMDLNYQLGALKDRSIEFEKANLKKIN